ncbi:MAG: thioredoxin [Anaerolineae bacterium]|nr:thioredoxin [Anaerolineae bacterium]
MVAHEAVIEVTEATFAEEVLERSYTTPVVVDFWAEWCGPCRYLGPVLEKLAAEGQGAWTLAKLNVDYAPNLSAQFGIQGIPAVKAFKNGKVVAQFVGAQPETNVRRFLSMLAPTPVARKLDQAQEAERAGRWETAATLYRQALAETPDDPQATLGLGRTLLGLDQLDEGIEWLAKVADHVEVGATARGLMAQARLTREAEAVGGLEGAQARLAANPGDLEGQYGLAAAYATEGEYAPAFDALLTIVRRNRGWQDGLARQTMIQLFDLLGDEDPLTREYRGKLSQALF